MLKGHVFNLQTFTSEAFAIFIDKFLNGRCGVAKGCELSNTNNSVTIADGFFVVRGRFLEVISGVTVSDITSNGFYSLICEIDLSKTNTADQLNQATIKVISGASAYPTLTQQDITGTGTVYVEIVPFVRRTVFTEEKPLKSGVLKEELYYFFAKLYIPMAKNNWYNCSTMNERGKAYEKNKKSM